jgi:hypothetical protein
LLYISHIDLFYKDTNNVEKVSVVVWCVAGNETGV